MLATGLAACSSDGRDFGPNASGGSGATPATGGSAMSHGGSATATGGSASGGTGNVGSTSGGSAPGGSGPALGGSSSGGSGPAGGSPAVGTGGAAGGTVGSGGSAPVNAILSADFESDAVGKQPTGWHNFIAYNIDATNPQSTLQAIVDDTKPHGGKNSLHVKSDGGPAFITMPLPANIKKLYVRGYFYMTRQLGQNPGANHETLFGIRKDKDNEIRFGEIKGVIGVNEVPSDNISPKMDLWGKGPLIAANKWACIEAAFIGDQTQNELHAWADGTEVLSVTSGDQWQNGTEPAGWLSDKWKEFMIGWQSFSSAKNELWIDDLVLSGTRVNCQ
ncbi:MAG TPA: hypothetical protein VER96_26550 [Polyangiaceae bacterium]|nr:hypothetical protein [Polyangiaceae bacterium]